MMDWTPPPPLACSLTPIHAPTALSRSRGALSVTQTDPDRKARLMKGLDSFLERDRDRELFDLVPKEVSK